MEDAKQIALRALTGAFIDRDPSVVERYFARFAGRWHVISHHGGFRTVALLPTLEGLVPPKQQEKSNDLQKYNRNFE